MTPRLETLCEALAQALVAHKLKMATAESCTGGLIAASCTQLPGSSVWFERGFVTYSNAAKTESLGVHSSLIEANGAVSEEVAKAMALATSSLTAPCKSMRAEGTFKSSVLAALE